jgi:hypothetical protein
VKKCPFCEVLIKGNKCHLCGRDYRNKSNEQGESVAFSKQQIRDEFLKNPEQAFAIAYNLVLKATGYENPGESIQLIGEVAKEFNVDITDCNWT